MEVSHGRWLFISHLSRILKRVGLSTSIVGDCIHDLTALSFERLASKHSGPQAVIIGTCAPHACAKQWLLIRIQSDARPGMIP